MNVIYIQALSFVVSRINVIMTYKQVPCFEAEHVVIQMKKLKLCQYFESDACTSAIFVAGAKFCSSTKLVKSA